MLSVFEQKSYYYVIWMIKVLILVVILMKIRFFSRKDKVIVIALMSMHFDLRHKSINLI